MDFEGHTYILTVSAFDFAAQAQEGLPTKPHLSSPESQRVGLVDATTTPIFKYEFRQASRSFSPLAVFPLRHLTFPPNSQGPWEP